MSAVMIEVMVWFQIACAIACIIRMVLGPTASDRLVALLVLSGVVLAVLVLLGVQEGRAIYLDVALVYDIFGFLGFLAIARFLKDRLADEGE